MDKKGRLTLGYVLGGLVFVIGFLRRAAHVREEVSDVLSLISWILSGFTDPLTLCGLAIVGLMLFVCRDDIGEWWSKRRQRGSAGDDSPWKTRSLESREDDQFINVPCIGVFPQLEGWSLTKGTEPKYEVLGRKGGHTFTRITPTDNYQLDYKFHDSLDDDCVVYFRIRTVQNSVIYVALTLETPSGGKARGWLNVCRGKQSPIPRKNAHEWEIFLSPKRERDNWDVYGINIKEWLGETFLKRQYEFLSFDGFRISGMTEHKDVAHLRIKRLQ